MLYKKKIFLLFSFLSTFLFLVVSTAIAETGTYQIAPQQQKVISINLNSGDSASGTIVVNGEGAIDFWISDPQNMNVTTQSYIGHSEFSFTAETSGTFLFYMFNRSMESSVTVTLNYNVVHNIFGMPQEIFLLLLIVGVVLLLLVIWAILSKA